MAVTRGRTTAPLPIAIDKAKTRSVHALWLLERTATHIFLVVNLPQNVGKEPDHDGVVDVQRKVAVWLLGYGRRGRIIVRSGARAVANTDLRWGREPNRHSAYQVMDQRCSGTQARQKQQFDHLTQLRFSWATGLTVGTSHASTPITRKVESVV